MGYTIPYGQVMKDALEADNLIMGHQAERFGRKLQLDINDFTDAVEGVTIGDLDMMMPAGTPAESAWRSTVSANTRLEIKRSIWDAYAPKFIDGLLNAAGTALDIVTLGVFGFGGKKEAEAKKISDALGYKMFDTRRRYFYLGVPNRVKGSGKDFGKTLREARGSLPAIGFNDPDLRDEYLGKLDQEYAKDRTYRGPRTPSKYLRRHGNELEKIY